VIIHPSAPTQNGGPSPAVSDGPEGSAPAPTAPAEPPSA
jgi:hypothetical protein